MLRSLVYIYIYILIRDPASACVFAVMSARIPISIVVHLAGVGDRLYPGGFSGTRGESRHIEGFQLVNPVVSGPALPNVSIEYCVHMQGKGDTAWVSQPQYAGTKGEGRWIEGFAAKLVGAEASRYDICYSAHVAGLGDVATSKNGAYCGTKGQSRRMEGLTMWLEVRQG